MNCPHCNARITADMAWCGLCHASLGADETQTTSHCGAPAYQPGVLAVDSHQAATYSDAVAPGIAAVDADGAAPQVTSARQLGDHVVYRFTDGSVAWQCALCSTMNYLDEDVCTACVTSLFSAAQDKPKAITRNPSTTLLWGLLPGGGQWYVGDQIGAIARAVVILLAVGAGFAYPAGSAIAPVRYAMFAIAIALWAVSAYDARQNALGAPDRALLRGRRLLWTTVVVLGLLIMSAFLAFGLGALTNVPAS